MTRLRLYRRLALGLVLALTAASCGSDDNASGGDGSGRSTTSTGAEDQPGGDLGRTAGFDGETIKLGLITVTSGPAALLGERITAGNQAYFDYINEEHGGIAGRYKVELVIRDSGYEPTKAVQEYSTIRDEVVMVAQILGTQVINGVLDQLAADGMVAAPASLDSYWVGEPNLIPIGGPYQYQAMNGLYWYIQEHGVDTVVCSLIQDDSAGEAGQEGLEFAAEHLGIDIAVTATFPAPPAVTDFTAQIGQLQRGGCEMVFLASTPTTTGAALGKAVEAGFGPQWIGLVSTWVDVLGASPLAPYLEEHLLVVNEGAEYGDTSVPGMAELARIRETYAPDATPDPYFNFGYMQGIAVTALLEAAVEQGDLSRSGLMTALESLGAVSFGGLSADYVYGPVDERVPPTSSSIFRVDPSTPMGITLVEGGGDVEAPFATEFDFTG